MNLSVSPGRNLYCIDKNYGGILIIWDRLFGKQRRSLSAFKQVENLFTETKIWTICKISVAVITQTVHRKKRSVKQIFFIKTCIYLCSFQLLLTVTRAGDGELSGVYIMSVFMFHKRFTRPQRRLFVSHPYRVRSSQLLKIITIGIFF